MRYSFVLAVSLTPTLLLAQEPANLLRNGEFQDDWITMLPETKNHHWCFPSEFFNRRDYNPDGWYCKGSWDWLNADAPWGNRRIVVNGPAELYQRVNWIAIHDDRQLEGFPDAGGYPVMKVTTSTRPERLARDLTFKVKLSGKNVPPNAGKIEVGVAPASPAASEDLLGARKPTTSASFVAIPPGTYKPQWLEVKLAAADWFVVKKGAAVELPTSIAVTIKYTAKQGSIEIERAELLASKSDAPNLLANGDFSKRSSLRMSNWPRPTRSRTCPSLIPATDRIITTVIAFFSIRTGLRVLDHFANTSAANSAFAGPGTERLSGLEFHSPTPSNRNSRMTTILEMPLSGQILKATSSFAG